MLESNEEKENSESFSTVKVLIVYYSRYGNTSRMAEEIAYGAKEISNIQVTIRRIADDIPMEVISKNTEWSRIVEDLNNRIPTVSIQEIVKELPNHDAIIFGSPTRFGNMAWPLKALWDATSELWAKGSLIGKIGAVFTSAASVHGGQETTAISMMFPMLHHGMLIVGVPYSVPELSESGSPYGPSRIVGALSNKAIKDADIIVARALGKRISEITKKFVISK
jgi:NAD(P)H dehydrogenase (quinone)